MCAIGIRRHKMLQHTLSANGTKDAELRHRGIVVNAKKIRRLMREHALNPKQRRRAHSNDPLGAPSFL